MALRQVNVKRMLAYSGISHAGFMLMTLLSVSNAGSLLYYTSAYALAIAAFSVILYVCKDSENEDITNFHGLGKTTISSYSNHLYCLWYPIFAGFFAKWFYSIKRFRLVILL
jgi:NADH-quinone oxidoreductase subunit N